MTSEYLIVGGGIGGLVLAELLARGGKKVVVLERSTGPPAWNRPEILWPVTADFLCQLVPRAVWEEEAVLPLAGMQIFDGEQFVWAMSPEILRSAQVQPWSTDPNRTRELLMRQRSFELARGVEVKEVVKAGERVVGVRARDLASGSEREWLAELTIGDDGANSLVRAACGIGLATRLFPLDLMCFQGAWPEALPPNAGRLWPNHRSARSGILLLGAIPVPHERAVGVMPVRPRVFEDLPRAQAAWREFTEMEPNLAALVGGRRFPEDFQRVRRPWGHAPRDGAAGALLMGDAAHPVSPAGGQGANMSIADGRVIAELALAGERDLLTTYERRRRPANRRSLRFTRLAAFAFGLPEWLFMSSLSLWLVRQVRRRPELIARFVRTASRAFLEG